MAGTVTRYQCEWCGAYVTWRNTPEGRRGFAESNRRHDFHLRPVGDEYHGRHRLEDGGISPSTLKAWALWWSLPAANRAPLIIDIETPDDLCITATQWLREGIDDDVPEYTSSSLLGTIPGAPYWIDGMLVFPYQRALPPGKNEAPGRLTFHGVTVETRQTAVDLGVADPEFEAWLRSVTPPPYP
ncbi:hypothetical protein SEA_ALI17_82 [Gordonia phage Ali17]|nr:hypothetical protein J1772_gp82 [Gordonia phage Ali17]AXQ60697.1 hypothetical protein SEA_ALI17_82 [Gordonia phage Ali17]